MCLIMEKPAVLGFLITLGSPSPPSKPGPPSLDHTDLVCAVGVQGW